MAVQVRWLVIQMEGQKLWPGYKPILLEGFKSNGAAERRAEELSGRDHEENDYVFVWDLALNKVSWGPK